MVSLFPNVSRTGTASQARLGRARPAQPGQERTGTGLRGRWHVLSLAGDGLRLFASDNGRLSPMTNDGSPAEQRSEVAAALAGAGRRPICVRLAPEFVLVRRLRIPGTALAEARRIAQLDLEQSTPLRAGDVLTAVRVDLVQASTGVRTGGSVAIEQHVVKRAVLRDVERLMREADRRADRIDCWAASPSDPIATAAVDIDLIERQGPEPGSGRTLMVLALIALALAGAAAATATLRLDGMLAEARTRSAELRRRHDVAEASRRERADKQRAAASLIGWWRAQPSTAVMLHHLTRLLPDTDHVTSLSLRGTSLELSGYTASSAGLLLAMERSGWLRNAALTTAATFDEASGRERFTLRVEVGPGDGAAKVREERKP